MDNDIPLSDRQLKVDEFEGYNAQDTSIHSPSADNSKSRNEWDELASAEAIKNSITPPNNSNRKDTNAKTPRPTPSPPKTAFMCFSSTKQNVDMESVAEQFRSLSSAEKAVWEEEARKDKARYAKEKADYGGPWQLVKRRAKKHPLAPKRPMSAFLRYSQSRRKAVKKDFPDIDNTDISRLLGRMWNRASEEEKRPYKTQELRERVKYKRDIAEWKWVQKRKEADAFNEAISEREPPSQVHMPLQPPEVDYRDNRSHYDMPPVHYNHDHHGNQNHTVIYPTTNVPNEGCSHGSFHYHTGEQYHRSYGDIPIYDEHVGNLHHDEGPGMYVHDNRHYAHSSRHNDTISYNSTPESMNKGEQSPEHFIDRSANTMSDNIARPGQSQEYFGPRSSHIHNEKRYNEDGLTKHGHDHGHYEHPSRHIDGSVSYGEHNGNARSREPTLSNYRRTHNDHWARF